jgi:hypothetical protein
MTLNASAERHYIFIVTQSVAIPSVEMVNVVAPEKGI